MFLYDCLFIVFLAVALADFILGIFPNVYGEPISSKDSSFYFCSYCMANGNTFAEIIPAGNLLGTKTIFNELIAFNDWRFRYKCIKRKKSVNYALRNLWFCKYICVGILLEVFQQFVQTLEARY